MRISDCSADVCSSVLIAVMHRLLVEEKRWIGEERFLHALNYCMLLPGPEAQQLAVYIGWLLHKTKGGLIAGTLFVLPGFLAILGLSYIYVLLGHVPVIEGLFFGLKAAVLAIVMQAVVRVGSRAWKNAAMRGIAVDRQSVVWGKSGTVRVDIGGGRIIKKKKSKKTPIERY